MNSEEQAITDFQESMKCLPGHFSAVMREFFTLWKANNPTATDSESEALFVGYCNGAMTALKLSCLLDESDLADALSALNTMMNELFESTGEGLH